MIIVLCKLKHIKTTKRLVKQNILLWIEPICGTVRIISHLIKDLAKYWNKAILIGYSNDFIILLANQKHSKAGSSAHDFIII